MAAQGNPPPNNIESPAIPPVQRQTPPPVDPAITALSGELAQTRQQMQRMQQQLGNAPQPQQNQQAPDRATLNRDFLRDPIEATRAISAQISYEMNQQLQQGSFETLVQVARTAARGDDPEDQALFDKYALEIESLVGQMQPQFRTNIHVWKNAVNTVFGNHRRDIRDAARQASPTGQAPAVHISQDGGPAPAGRAAAPNSNKEIKLTAEEQEVATGLGITAAEYNRGREMYENQQKRGPSSWDKFVTFSTKAKRKERHEAQRAAAVKK